MFTTVGRPGKRGLFLGLGIAQKFLSTTAPSYPFICPVLGTANHLHSVTDASGHPAIAVAMARPSIPTAIISEHPSSVRRG
jgi:hypothetical protein